MSGDNSLEHDAFCRLQYNLLTRTLDTSKVSPEEEQLGFVGRLLSSLCEMPESLGFVDYVPLKDGAAKARYDRYRAWLQGGGVEEIVRMDDVAAAALNNLSINKIPVAERSSPDLSSPLPSSAGLSSPLPSSHFSISDILDFFPAALGDPSASAPSEGTQRAVAGTMRQARESAQLDDFSDLLAITERMKAGAAAEKAAAAVLPAHGSATSGHTAVSVLPVAIRAGVSLPATRYTEAVIDAAPPSHNTGGAVGYAEGIKRGFSGGSSGHFESTAAASMLRNSTHPAENVGDDAAFAGFKRNRQQMSDAVGPTVPEGPPTGFLTGRQQLRVDNAKAGRKPDGGFGDTARAPPVEKDNASALYGSTPQYSFNSTAADKSRKGGAGLRRFKPPSKLGDEPPSASGHVAKSDSAAGASATNNPSGVKSKILEEYGENLPEVLKNCEPKLIEMIENEIMDCGEQVTFDDIAGLYDAKAVMVEAVVWPMQMPELFSGLTRQPKGVLLFGPPGTGKTLIGKAVAHECGATFFAISASSLTSKWIGESEKLVRTLFAVASLKQPSIIFMDEIDSLLTARGDGEHESSRRVKTEFLVQLDGAATRSSDFVLVIGATNRPQELDEAARRRFTKRIYVPLPDPQSRRALICRLLAKEKHCLTPEEIEEVVTASDGYSGADVTQVCREAAMGALRIGLTELVSRPDIARTRGIPDIKKEHLPPINLDLFRLAFETVKPSVAQSELTHYIKWNAEFGSEASKSALQTLNIMRTRRTETVADGDDISA